MNLKQIYKLVFSILLLPLVARADTLPPVKTFTGHIKYLWLNGDTGVTRFSTVEPPPTSDACMSNWGYFLLSSTMNAIPYNVAVNLQDTSWSIQGMTLTGGISDPASGNNAWQISVPANSSVIPLLDNQSKGSFSSISIWAKAADSTTCSGDNTCLLEANLNLLGSLGMDAISQNFSLTSDWQLYTFNISGDAGNVVAWSVGARDSSTYVDVPTQNSIIDVYLPQVGGTTKTEKWFAGLIDAKANNTTVTISYNPRTSTRSCDNSNTDDLLASVIDIVFN